MPLIVTDTPYSWLRLCISMLAATVSSVGLWAAVLVLPKVQLDFDIDRSTASAAYTAVMLGFAFGNLVLGRLVDRFGIAPILGICGLTLSAGFGLSTLSQSILQFSLLQFVIGFVTAAGFAPLIADVSHWFRKRRGIAVAATASGNYFAGALWPLALKGIIATEGWREAFGVIALVCLVTLLPLSLVLRRRRPALPTGRSAPLADTPLKSISLSPGAMQTLLLVAGLACCMAMAMPQVHIVAYCADLGFGVGIGAEMLSIMLAAGVVSRLVSGLMADSIGGVPTLLIGSILQCLALFLYLPFDGLVSLYVVSLIFGLSQGGIVPSYAIIVREYLPAEEAGKRIGILMVATVTGMALGGWVSGLIYDWTGSYQAAFLNGIAWNLLNIAIMIFILIRSRPAPRRGAIRPAGAV